MVDNQHIIPFCQLSYWLIFKVSERTFFPMYFHMGMQFFVPLRYGNHTGIASAVIPSHAVKFYSCHASSYFCFYFWALVLPEAKSIVLYFIFCVKFSSCFCLLCFSIIFFTIFLRNNQFILPIILLDCWPLNRLQEFQRAEISVQ